MISTAISSTGEWITDKAWISGLSGALGVLLCGYWFNRTNALQDGVGIAGWKLTPFQLARQLDLFHIAQVGVSRRHDIDSILAALLMCCSVMLIIEGVRLWLWDRRNYFCIHPDLREGNYLIFFFKVIGNYLLNLTFLGLVMLFYRSAGEYGYLAQNDYYQPWFRMLELAIIAYVWLGLPYVLLTRAVKHSPAADRRDMSMLLVRAALWIGAWLSVVPRSAVTFDGKDKKAIRALLVKLFFAPLMTVFFVDHFPNLVNNFGYIIEHLPRAISNHAYSHQRFNSDFFNITITFIFSIDVALAWCGYVVSSRWVDNQTASAEPTMLGWLVCVCCYPPFQQFLGLYYSPPNEREILQFTNQWLITISTGMMLTSYLIYMSATLWFGVRFSNLTNRGIIRKGPYALVRHPAYAAKNFAWWCVMFPAVIYNAMYADTTLEAMSIAALQITGLVFMTWFYYLRAITEERHLNLDPAYQDYCQQVKYRFIPGVL
ncbi:hypothetical protein JXA32_14160 [Candidatus Sumerlaeota bacterium]|nr:hypothetical protein [Candidatus Sumerlaeota bacterium]